MAWNVPGNSGSEGGKGDNRKPAGGGGFGPLSGWLSRFGGGLPGQGGAARWVLIALALWLAMNCFVLVAEQQRAVVLRFGQFHRTLQPGPHFKLPWPLESVTKVNATQSNSYSDQVPVLTRDLNMVKVDINVQYRIGDAQQYLFGTRKAEDVLKEAAQSAVREIVGRSDMDTVLFARGAMTATVRDRLQRSLELYDTGLVITELNLPDARYPDEVKDAFDEAQRASQDKTTSINEAQAYAKQIVPEARGLSARVRTEAQGYKTASIARASGDAQRFDLLVAQYKAAPEVTRKRLWLETVQDVLSHNRKVVGGDGRQLIYVPMPGASADAQKSGTSVVPAIPELIAPPVQATQETRPARTDRPAGREETTR